MADQSTPPRRKRLWIAALLGVPLGLGVFTMHYARGSSYLSDDPRACVNCHIMQHQYDGWQRASHHAVATCVDCHLPSGLLDKWIAKGVNGWNHSTAFTFQNFHEPIRTTERSAQILQENCVRCHGELLHQQVSGAKTDIDAIRCVHCHRRVGHGPRMGLGGPDRGEAEESGK